MIRKQRRLAAVGTHTILVLLCAGQIGPLLIVLLNSFRTEFEIKYAPIGWPQSFSFANYAETWRIGGYAVAYRNGFIVSFTSIATVCVLTCLAAYGLTKLQLYGQRFFTAYFLIAVSIPAFSFLVVDYYVLTKLGLVNRLASVIIIYTATNLPFNLILVRAYFLGIPRELEESAKIDGCSELRTLLRITMPLAKPILVTVALMVFIATWNEFMFANTFLQSDEVKTAAVRFYKFIGKYSSDPSKIYTASLITMAPVLLLFLCLQKTFIEGITAGSVKG